MKKYLALIALATSLSAVSSQASIISSGTTVGKHDFSGASWNSSRHGVCSPCHSAHTNNPNRLVPLWGHATSAAAFTVYSSSSMSQTVPQPASASLACLSCHDGVTAINQTYSGQLAGTFTGGSAVLTGTTLDTGSIGTNLQTTHPVSIQYTDTMAGVAGSDLNPPSSTNLTWGGNLVGKSIKKALLHNGDTMECSSCHDPHQTKGDSTSSGIMAVISGVDSNNRGSTLCRTCHTK